ncbi:MAG: type pilus assembly PilZ [Panacagrimonas sp.]|nr:type pilus assembly PilZ [Panacagrimonas sp.]
MNRRSAAAVAANPNPYAASGESNVPPNPPRAATHNLVHESEIQRQYVRAKVPGVLELSVPQGGTQRFRLHDLSGGGLAFDAQGHSFRVGEQYTGRIHLKLETISVAVPVRFDVRSADPSGRVGVRFEQLDATAISTLRRVVSGFLGGELVGAGELMHTLSRNNFGPARANKPAPVQRRGFGSRFRAMAQTAVVLLLGLVALIYTAQRVDEKLFGANSTAARVSGPRFQVAMPRDGIYRSLIPADGIVKKGSAIGSFQTSMFGLVNAQALEAQLTQAEIDKLLSKEVQGTVTSPCDCRVLATYAADGQYVGKGQHIADLAPIEFEPYVVARFGYREAERLQPGTQVTLHINGDPLPRTGHVSQLRHDGDPDSLSQDVVVMVTPDDNLPMDLMSRPVQVSAANRSWLSTRSLGGFSSAHAESRP